MMFSMMYFLELFVEETSRVLRNFVFHNYDVPTVVQTLEYV